MGMRGDKQLDFPEETHNKSNYVTAGMALSGIPEDASHNELYSVRQKTTDKMKLLRPGQDPFNQPCL